MRIAVLLYGHVRTFQQCWESLIENVVKVNSGDVFMHTWDEIDHSTKSWYGQVESVSAFDNQTEKLIRKCYSPKKLLIEHQEAWDGDEFTYLEEPKLPVVTDTAHFLFYSMGQANRLRREYERKTGVKYDYVFVTRPDIQFRSTLDVEKVIWQAEVSGVDLDNTRFVAYTHTANKHPQKLLINRVNDLLFFGKSEVIDRYIKANTDLPLPFMQAHALNYPSIYTAAELAAGIVPLHIAYTYKDDWANIQTQERKDAMEKNNISAGTAKASAPAQDPHTAEKKKTEAAAAAPVNMKTEISGIKRAVKTIAKVFFYPLKRFYHWSKTHFQWLTED